MGTQDSTMASTGPKVTVHIVTGRASRSSREMSGRTLLIGSDPECDVQMRSLEVGDHHCLITRRPNAVVAKRLASDFPVLINGQSITEQELRDGDTLQIGPFQLRVSIEGLQLAEEPAPPPRRPAAVPVDYQHVREPEDFGYQYPPVAPAPNTAPAPNDAYAQERRRPVAPTSPTQAPPAARVQRPLSRAAKLARHDEQPPMASFREREIEPARPAPRVERAFESTSEVFKRLSNLKQNEIERQQRELHELRVKLEKENAELQQARRQLQQEKDSLARGYKEQARREQELQEKIHQLELRQEAQRATEQGIEHQRVMLTEDMLEFDHRKAQLVSQKQKLIRIREKLFQQYRERRQMVAELVENLERRATEIQEQEKQVAIARSRAEDREAQASQRDHELASREHRIARDTERLAHLKEEIESEKARIAEEQEDLRHKEQSLTQLGEELQRRQAHLNNLEAEVVEKDRLAQEELDQVRERGRDVQRRLQEIEARSQTIDAQQAHFRELEQTLEQQRSDQARRQRELDAREAKIETLEADLEHKQQELQRKEQQLRDQILRQKEAEQHLARKREENDKETLELQRRSTELEEQAQALYEELEQRRTTLERLQKDVEQAQAYAKEGRAKLEADQDAWTERVCAVREESAEVAQMAALLQQQRHVLDSKFNEISKRQDELAEEKARIEQEREHIKSAREQLEHTATEVRQKHEELDAESDRLQELAHQLAQRQQDLVRRENAWCEDVKRRRRELEQQAEEIEQQRVTLDRQIRAHRRQVHKLREVSLKVAQRKKESNALLESVQKNGQLREHEVEALRENHQELIESLQEYADQAANRERELTALRDAMKSESSHLTTAQKQVQEHLRELLLDCATTGTGDLAAVQQRRREITKQLENSLAEWSTHLTRLQQSAGVAGDKAVSAPKVSLPQPVSVQTSPADAAASEPEPAEQSVQISASASEAAFESELSPYESHALHLYTGDTADEEPLASQELKPAPSVVKSPPTPAKPEIKLTDAEKETLQRAVQAGIVEGDTDVAAIVPLMAAGASFEQAMIQAELLTAYQFAHLRSGDLAPLKIGSAIVLDRIHSDSIATTYKVRIAEEAEPVALWLLEKRWCKDAQLRKTFEINVDPLTSFRNENVAAVRSVFTAEDRYGLIGDFVNGASLADLVQHGMPPAALVHYTLQTAKGLAAAHRAGFLHHNLRPRRIMVEASNTVKIVGYGEPVWLSKIQRCENAKKIGRYVAPEEHAAGQPGDVRADLYSLGQIVVELLGVIDKSELPHGFEALMTQLCHDTPSQRCRAAADVLSMLEEMVNEMGLQTPWPALPSVLQARQSTQSEPPALRKAA